MEYPSFLWRLGTAENEAREPVIPEETLRDLKITGLVRREIERYARIPCGREEIEKRQRLFQALERNPEAVPALERARAAVLNVKKLYFVYTSAEGEPEKSLFFPAFVSSFLDGCRELSNLAQVDQAFQEVGGFFRDLIREPELAALADALSACEKLRGEDVRLSVNGASLSAGKTAEPMQRRFQTWFRQMGIPEEAPAGRMRRRLEPVFLRAYAEVYHAYYTAAGELAETYREILLGERFQGTELLCYSDEIAFLLDGIRFLSRFRESGYPLTYPTVSEERRIEIEGVVDPALMKRELLAAELVPNDVSMSLREGKLNFYIVSGANGGGKTTYLRAVGSAVLLFLLGLPVTAAKATIYPFRKLFTHFPSNESFENSGRFLDEVNRADEIRKRCGPDTVALFNETYSGTDEKKSEEYSRLLAEEMFEKEVFGLYVTHIHALTNGEIPVLEAQVDETDENRRTYRIRRAVRTKSSYAYDILKKYGLDRESLGF